MVLLRSVDAVCGDSVMVYGSAECGIESETKGLAVELRKEKQFSKVEEVETKKVECAGAKVLSGCCWRSKHSTLDAGGAAPHRPR